MFSKGHSNVIKTIEDRMQEKFVLDLIGVVKWMFCIQAKFVLTRNSGAHKRNQCFHGAFHCHS